MYETVKIIDAKTNKEGTHLHILLPDKKLITELNKKNIVTAMLKFDDGRKISSVQIKKAYATMQDIADSTGYTLNEIKETMKTIFCDMNNLDDISLGNCTMDQGREFINFLMDYSLMNGIPLRDFGVNRTDDINKYLYQALKHRKCACCGLNGEIHHEDAIGMGNNRLTLDDSNHKKICLCRGHHSEAHVIGTTTFFQRHKVYGILFNE